MGNLMVGLMRFLPQVILCIVAQVFMLGFWGTITGASADEKDARNLFKAMSDYMAAQKTIAYQFETNLEVVTTEKQKLGLASTGTLTLNRPDKFRIRRTGGFADVEFLFDGKILTLLGKTANLYGQLEVPGTIDHLIDELRDKYGKPVPGADLLLSNINDELMATVVDVKDMGSGVIGGVECDHLIRADMSSPTSRLIRHRNIVSRSVIGKPATRLAMIISASTMSRTPKRSIWPISPT